MIPTVKLNNGVTIPVVGLGTSQMKTPAETVEVIKMALKAADLIGDGFYGVDLKEVGRRCCVIEVNDNPNVDAGHEDGVLKDALYREVMAVFAKRIEARRRGVSP